MDRSENEALVRRWLDELVNQENPEVLDACCAEAFFDHNPPAGAQEGGIGATREGAERLRQGLSDVRVSVNDVLSDGDRVFVRSSVYGTHTGDLMGLRPTGKRLKLEVWHLFLVQDGKILEHRAQSDTMALLRQIAGGPQKTAEVIFTSQDDAPGTLA